MLFRKKEKPVEAATDEEVVAELQRHMDADQFGVLYDRYTAKVYQRCLSMTGDRQLAADLTHDIFLKAFIALKGFDHRSRFGTWLYSITYNYCLDHLRKQQRSRAAVLNEEACGAPDDDGRFEAELLEQRAEALQAALAALDPDDRVLLLMKYQDELSVKEIAGMLGLGESAVKMRLLRARERAVRLCANHQPEAS